MSPPTMSPPTMSPPTMSPPTMSPPTMRYMTACLVALSLAALTLGFSSQAEETRMTPELLWRLGRVSDGVLSADGTQAAYVVRRYELAENEGRSEIHLLTLETGRDTILADDLKSASDLQWGTGPFAGKLLFVGKQAEPDAKKDADEADREGDDGDDKDEDDEEKKTGPQLWSLDPSSQELIQVTDYKDGVANLKLAPTGDRIAFTMDVKLDSTVNDLYEDLPDADARIIDSLLFRHWNAWHDYKFSHLHVATITDGKAAEPTDLMEGLRRLSVDAIRRCVALQLVSRRRGNRLYRQNR